MIIIIIILSYICIIHNNTNIRIRIYSYIFGEFETIKFWKTYGLSTTSLSSSVSTGFRTTCAYKACWPNCFLPPFFFSLLFFFLP